MIEDVIINLAKEALLLVIYLSAPPVIASLVVGFTISLFQATTQIQDQSLTFTPKLVAVLLSLIIFGTWGAKHAINFGLRLMGNFQNIVQ